MFDFFLYAILELFLELGEESFFDFFEVGRGRGEVGIFISCAGSGIFLGGEELFHFLSDLLLEVMGGGGCFFRIRGGGVLVAFGGGEGVGGVVGEEFFGEVSSFSF